MKRLIKKTQKITKGKSSGMLISLVVHAAAFLLAGLLVVFEVFDKPPVTFVPPKPIDRPKMQLKKPRVKLKKNIKPRATRRIVAKNVQVMADVQLPEMSSGLGSISGGIGGFDMMPDPSEMNLFGSSKSLAVGNDFEGTFYSLVYDRAMNPIRMQQEEAFQIVADFVESGWKPQVLARYFRAPQKLYTTHFAIPSLGDDSGPPDIGRGPEFFGIGDPNFNPIHWIVHYKGKIASPKTGKFRFWGTSNGAFVVSVNGKVVFDGTWTNFSKLDWKSPSKENNKYMMLTHSAKVGEWFELEADTPVEMEVVMYKNQTRKLGYMLTVEDADEDRVINTRTDLPVFPAFKTAEFTPAQLADIEYLLLRDEADLRSGLLFNVY